MATTSRTDLRKALSENTGDHFAFTTSADGSSTKDSIVADILKNQPLGTDPDGFERRHFLATDGGNSGESRICKNYAPLSTNGAEVLTQSTFTNATSSGDAFEMHRIDPELKHVALSRALNELFPTLYLSKRDETLIVDSLLLNGDFEDWSSGVPDNWTLENSPTVTQETTIVFHGSSSLKIVAGGSVGRVYQDVSLNLDDAAGRSLLFKMRAWSAGASEARLVLNFGGSDTDGTFHDGDSDWQLLNNNLAVPTDATRARVICEVAATKTAYFDLGWAAVDPLYQYAIPSSMIRGPFQVEQQHNENDVKGLYYPLLPGESPKQGRILRLRGMGVLTVPTTESGTTEVGEPRLRLVAAYAALMLVEMLGERSASEQITNLQSRMTRWERTIARLSSQPGIRMAPMAASRGKNAWHIEEDSTGKLLIFDAARAGARSF